MAGRLVVSGDVDSLLLFDTHLKSCTARNIEATDCTFTDMDIFNSKLYHCTLVRCRITKQSSVNYSTLRGCFLASSMLAESTVTRGPHPQYPGSRPLHYSRLIEVSITRSTILNSSLRKCSAYYTNIKDCNYAIFGSRGIFDSVLVHCELDTCEIKDTCSILKRSVAGNSSIHDAVVENSVVTSSKISNCRVTSSALALCDSITDTSFVDSVINSSSIDKCGITGCSSIFGGSKARDTTFDNHRIIKSTIRRSIIYQCNIRNSDSVQTSEIIEVEALATLFTNCKITKSVMVDSTMHECGNIDGDNTLTNCELTRAPLAFSKLPLELVADLFSKMGPGDVNLVAAMRGHDFIYKEAMKQIFKNHAVAISDSGLSAAMPYPLASVSAMHLANTHTLDIFPRPIATPHGLHTYNIPTKVRTYAKVVRHLRVDFEGHVIPLQHHKVYNVARVWTAAMGTIRQISMVVVVPNPAIDLEETERRNAVAHLNSYLHVVGMKTVDITVTPNQETWTWKAPPGHVLVWRAPDVVAV